MFLNIIFSLAQWFEGVKPMLSTVLIILLVVLLFPLIKAIIEFIASFISFIARLFKGKKKSQNDSDR